MRASERSGRDTVVPRQAGTTVAGSRRTRESNEDRPRATAAVRRCRGWNRAEEGMRGYGLKLGAWNFAEYDWNPLIT